MSTVNVLDYKAESPLLTLVKKLQKFVINELKYTFKAALS
jgi:hypothetical protein